MIIMATFYMVLASLFDGLVNNDKEVDTENRDLLLSSQPWVRLDGHPISLSIVKL